MDTLINYAEKYEIYYKQDILPIFHVACSCVTSQQVSFTVGRAIRKQLYEICGFPLTREKLSSIDLTKINNLTSTRIELLKQIANVIVVDRSDIDILNDYSKLKGFGKWTHGAVSILLGLDNNVNLSSDAYIRKNLALYCDSNTCKMSEKACRDYIETANNYNNSDGNNMTKICYLLWRLKSTSIYKIKDMQILTRDDFV
jgi:3-methyladenine DNA glycosylase/8-oxoguanine DNA glycosylase